MIYDLTKKFLFIHIPRTGGMAITHSLAERCPDAVVDTFERRHWYAARVFEEIPELRRQWDFLYRFAVMRNPWEIIASDYNLTQRDTERLTPASAAYIPHKWHKRLLRSQEDPSFEGFVQREHLGDFRPTHYAKGFWRTWCYSYENTDMGLHVIQYENLAQEWPNVCKRIGIEPYDLPMLNNVPHTSNVSYSQELQEKLKPILAEDVHMFGYRLPDHLAP